MNPANNRTPGALALGVCQVLENRADLNDILQAYDVSGELRTELEKLGAKIFSHKP